MFDVTHIALILRKEIITTTVENIKRKCIQYFVRVQNINTKKKMLTCFGEVNHRTENHLIRKL